MEHLHKKTCFINEHIYTTSKVVASDISELLYALAKNSTTENIDILCDELPISELLTKFSDYILENMDTNATFMYLPYPIDLIKPNTIHICTAHYENNIKKIHQIAFMYNGHYFRFGVSI